MSQAYDASYGSLWVSLFQLNPQAIVGQYTAWQLFTFLFIHTSPLHLVFNMLGLWWFGSDLEKVWGSTKFFKFYVFTGIGSGLVSLIMNKPTIGASGAIYGLLFAFGMLYAERTIHLYFVIPIKAKYFVLIFGLISLASLVFVPNSSVNHWAHLAGLFFGFLWFFIEKNHISPKALLRKYRYYRHRKRFKVIVNQKPDVTPIIKGPYGDEDNPTIH